MVDLEVRRLMEDYPRIYLACHTEHVRDDTAGHTLSAHQAGILSHLDAVDPTRITELARHMGVTLSTMSLAVSRLVRQGYVTRRRDAQDARSMQVRLTPAGVRVKESQSVLDGDKVRRLLRRIPAERRARALEGLRILAEAAGQLLAARSAGGRGVTTARTQ